MSKIWRYGDHVDTDVIIPARYLNISDFKELAEQILKNWRNIPWKISTLLFHPM